MLQIGGQLAVAFDFNILDRGGPTKLIPD